MCVYKRVYSYSFTIHIGTITYLINNLDISANLYRTDSETTGKDMSKAKGPGRSEAPIDQCIPATSSAGRATEVAGSMGETGRCMFWGVEYSRNIHMNNDNETLRIETMKTIHYVCFNHLVWFRLWFKKGLFFLK